MDHGDVQLLDLLVDGGAGSDVLSRLLLGDVQRLGQRAELGVDRHLVHRKRKRRGRRLGGGHRESRVEGGRAFSRHGSEGGFIGQKVQRRSLSCNQRRIS